MRGCTADIGQHTELMITIRKNTLYRFPRIMRHWVWLHLNICNIKSSVTIYDIQLQVMLIGHITADHFKRAISEPHGYFMLSCKLECAARMVIMLVRDDYSGQIFWC